MIPIDAREIIKKDTQYSNPFLTGQRTQIPSPLLVNVSDSEDSLFLEQSPMNRSEGEIGGELYI